KAGVGGSIPSLATIKSEAYRPSDSQFHSNSFQNQMVRPVLPQGEPACLEWSVCTLKTPRSKQGYTTTVHWRTGEQMRVAIYIRVSTGDQNNELQLRELQEYAERHGWGIAQVYE